MQNFNKGLKKNKRKNKILFSKQLNSLPPQIQNLKNVISQAVNLNNHIMVQAYLKVFNLDVILNNWQDLENSEKIQLLKSITFSYFNKFQTITTFKPKRQLKQIFILLKGNLLYKLNVDNDKFTINYQAKQGQLIYQPYPLDLYFNQFSIIANQPCVMLKMCYNNFFFEKINKCKQFQLSKLINNIKKINSINDQFKSISSIMPYFSTVMYKKGQIIKTQTIQNQKNLFYLSKGIIQVSKYTNFKKQLSIVQILQGQFFNLTQQSEGNQENTLKCKSIQCQIYIIPTIIVNYYGGLGLKQSLFRKSVNEKKLYTKIFHKNEKVIKNSQKIVQKPKSKDQSIKRKLSLNLNHSWDLIGHIANKMNMKSPTLMRMKNNVKSANISPRVKIQNQSKNRVVSIQKLRSRYKQIEEQYSNNEDFPSQFSQSAQPIQIHNVFRKTLKPSWQCRSNSLSLIPRVTNTDMHNLRKKKKKIDMINNTKVKLLRYANGQNIYGLDDIIIGSI